MLAAAELNAVFVSTGRVAVDVSGRAVRPDVKVRVAAVQCTIEWIAQRRNPTSGRTVKGRSVDKNATIELDTRRLPSKSNVMPQGMAWQSVICSTVAPFWRPCGKVPTVWYSTTRPRHCMAKRRPGASTKPERSFNIDRNPADHRECDRGIESSPRR
jgi:hypothetical protein